MKKDDPERIVKIGPLELWGRRRQEPPEGIQTLSAAVETFRQVMHNEVLTPYVLPVVQSVAQWLSRLLRRL